MGNQQPDPPVLPGPHFCVCRRKSSGTVPANAARHQQTPGLWGTFRPREMFLLYSLPCACCSTTACCVKPKRQKREGCFPEGCWGDAFPSSGSHVCSVHSSPLAPCEITTSDPSKADGGQQKFSPIAFLPHGSGCAFHGRVPLQNAPPRPRKGLGAGLAQWLQP